MEHYDSRFEMCLNYKKDIMEKQVQFIDSLAIDDNVKINTSAAKKMKDHFKQYGFYPYDFIFTQLRKNLQKYI